MNEKQKIIVNEIQKWRESKLLPEKYCDFLISLYTEGNAPDTNTDTDTEPSKALLPALKKMLITIGLILVVLILLILFLYFTQMPPVFQIGMLALVMIFSVAAAFFYQNKDRIYTHVYIILAAFMSFILTVVGTDLFFDHERMFLGGAIIILCLLWVLAGWRLRLPYLWISGVSGVILFIGFLIVERL
ncbi:DUF2157 domain-containing protein [Salisediminibacterium beveridgei]|uniref:DUF2157 domain-containing protein n=1 Tax=Salisediminibacterium beveridgei TaxID=632773 RepID=A0A1D7QUB2_9BACI|nr:DUF2157 domain-containing protein [Salisediminibacterium beveridgei]AOM82601.1 hypothetical protein BBEV_1233 [Salisediminibacterium beveridgei]